MFAISMTTPRSLASSDRKSGPQGRAAVTQDTVEVTASQLNRRGWGLGGRAVLCPRSGLLGAPPLRYDSVC